MGDAISAAQPPCQIAAAPNLSAQNMRSTRSRQRSLTDPDFHEGHF
jgi:hypothetical protein